MPPPRVYRPAPERAVPGLVAGVVLAVLTTWAAFQDSWTFKSWHVDAPWSHLVAGTMSVLLWAGLLTVILLRGRPSQPGLVLDDDGIHDPLESTRWAEVLAVTDGRRIDGFAIGPAGPLPRYLIVRRRMGPDHLIHPASVGSTIPELRRDVDAHWRAWCRIHDRPGPPRPG